MASYGRFCIEVGSVFGTAAPSIQNLILAGHSKAYAFFDPLAMAHGDPEMSKGCLAKLSDVWALDTTYTCPTDHLALLARLEAESQDADLLSGKERTPVACGRV